MAPRLRSRAAAPEERRHRQVAQRQRRGVGGVGGLGEHGQPETGLHHLLHLQLVGPAPSGDGVLDLVGGVLDDLAPGEGGLGEREAARLADAHRRSHVDLEEDLLHGDHIGAELADQVGELGSQRRRGAAAAGRCGVW
jgi:hypothetical protein